MPTTIEELLKMSEQCYNYGSYNVVSWKRIAKYLANLYGCAGAYAVLDSKHMRWCERQTFPGFKKYAEEELNQDEVNQLLGSY